MKTCKSCGTVLNDSFVLGSKCPNCRIKIVYEEIQQASLLEKITNTVKIAGSIIGALIGIVIIVTLLWSLISKPFQYFNNSQNGKIINSYYKIAAEIEHTLSLENTEQSLDEFESYVIKHKEVFENLAKHHKVLKGELFVAVYDDRNADANISGKAAKFIVDNKDKFNNNEVKMLLQKIGFF